MRMLKSPISLCTTKLNMYFDDSILSSGSGFFYEYLGRHFLVTNRHNLTGRHQDSGAPLSPTAGIPNRLIFETPTITGVGPSMTVGAAKSVYDLKWPEHDKPWREHPTLGERADVVAIDLQRLWPESPSPQFCANSLPDSQPLMLLPSSRVSVVGYPFGKSVAEHYPVWVTGSIASEPDFDADGKPAIYVDCRTNRGSSGSPVFLMVIGSSAPVDSDPVGKSAIMRARFGEGTEFVTFSTVVHRFIGIYSGRVDANADIGLVWRHQVIEDVCSAGVKPN